MKTFNQKIKVVEQVRLFSELEVGDGFTFPHYPMRISKIFVGFPVCVKLDDKKSVELDTGKLRYCDSEAEVLKVIFGEINDIYSEK